MKPTAIQVLFLTPYPHNTAGSQRFRFEQYLALLKSNGISYDMQSFLDVQTWEILYQEGYQFQKIWGLVKGFARRLGMLGRVGRYDIVFIHREAAPIGPPIFEWVIANIFKKKIIYDFDDAIWKSNTTAENSWSSWFKWHHKVASICGWSWKVSVGNAFLSDYARPFNDRTFINPTTIDTGAHHIPRKGENHRLTIGWTGSHSTLKYLDPLVAPLNELAAKFDFDFLVIADKNPQLLIRNFQFVKWELTSEIDDLDRIDIGLMPLTDDEWSKGKCGFKALQFMALETPVLVSPVGVNDQMVVDGVHGFHCTTSGEWLQSLEKLMRDDKLRASMGLAGRKHVISSYSLQSNSDNFLRLFL